MTFMRERNQTTARRAALGLTRATLKKVDDTKRMQEVDLDMLHDEGRQGVERWENYGHFSHPPAPEEGKEPEALVAQVGGSRSHSVVVGLADRRHRPRNSKPGEAGMHDDQGQVLALRRDGLKGENVKMFELPCGRAKFRIKPGRVEVLIDDVMQFLVADAPDDGMARVLTENGPALHVFGKA